MTDGGQKFPARKLLWAISQLPAKNSYPKTAACNQEKKLTVPGFEILLNHTGTIDGNMVYVNTSVPVLLYGSIVAFQHFSKLIYGITVQGKIHFCRQFVIKGGRFFQGFFQ